MRARLGIAIATLFASLVSAPQAFAQDAATLKKDMVGQWELSTTERSKTCVVTLKSDSTPQGLKLELEPGCAKALPFTKDITAWNVKGLDIVRLQDATGQSVIDFTEVGNGLKSSIRDGVSPEALRPLEPKTCTNRQRCRGRCEEQDELPSVG